MYEERETYYEVLVTYAEILWYLYESNPQVVNLEDIEKYVREVEKARKAKPLDIIYLKSLFILGNLEQAKTNYQKAGEIYNKALLIISQAKTETRELPPHFKMLEETIEKKLFWQRR